MNARRPTAIVADDEPILRSSLARMLADAWPELDIVAEARNGREAVTLFESHRPDICFLDVHMPGLTGVEAARKIGGGAHLVFVTAFDQYAVQAFEQRAIDYLVKPLDAARLAETVARLKERMSLAPGLRRGDISAETEALLQQIAERLGKKSGPPALRWIHATVGNTVRMIPVEDIAFLRSDEKYTLVAWRDDGRPAEGLIRTPLKELVEQLDGEIFLQVHRSVVVNRNVISHFVRLENETGQLHLRGREDVVPVSRSYLHLFKQM
ncbi:MAG TPA: LytTR family DNA-binding domain-containing protein [Usitatibacter sp.]|nr:LytTR family DNA-binding domain-containing protein [Usitatibacter sp.]